jgi:hypothetical protein
MRFVFFLLGVSLVVWYPRIRWAMQYSFFASLLLSLLVDNGAINLPASFRTGLDVWAISFLFWVPVDALVLWGMSKHPREGVRFIQKVAMVSVIAGFLFWSAYLGRTMANQTIGILLTMLVASAIARRVGKDVLDVEDPEV